MSNSEAFDRHVRFGDQQLKREATYIVSEMRRTAARGRRNEHYGKGGASPVAVLEHPLTKQSVDERTRNQRIEEITRNNMQKGCRSRQPALADLVSVGNSPGKVGSRRPTTVTTESRRIAVAALLVHGAVNHDVDAVYEESETFDVTSIDDDDHFRLACVVIQRWWRTVSPRLSLRNALVELRLWQASIYIEEAARVIVRFMRSVCQKRQHHLDR